MGGKSADILTQREAEVGRLLAAGFSNAAIAHQLTISVDTVKTHVRHILSKLGLKSRHQLRADHSLEDHSSGD